MDTNQDIELENIIIDNFIYECYICFETINDKEYSILQCCNKSKCSNKIHNTCLFKLFLESTNLNCPLCRSILNIKEYLNKDNLKMLYDKLDENEKLRYKIDIHERIDISEIQPRINPQIHSHYMLCIIVIFIIFIVGLFIYIICSKSPSSNSSVNVKK